MVVVSFPDPPLRDAVGAVPGVEAVLWDPAGDAAPTSGSRSSSRPTSEPRPPSERWPGSPACRLVQLQSAGYDGVLEVVPEEVGVANAAGVYDAATAELAVGLTIASLRGIPDSVRSGDEARWTPLGRRPSLAGPARPRRRLRLGRQGRRPSAQPFEVTLTAVASRARSGDDLVDTVHGIDELPDTAARARRRHRHRPAQRLDATPRRRRVPRGDARRRAPRQRRPWPGRRHRRPRRPLGASARWRSTSPTRSRSRTGIPSGRRPTCSSPRTPVATPRHCCRACRRCCATSSAGSPRARSRATSCVRLSRPDIALRQGQDRSMTTAAEDRTLVLVRHAKAEQGGLRRRPRARAHPAGSP